MEATRSNYARGRIWLESGYRCPRGNVAIGSTSTLSRHQYGDGADFWSLDHLNTYEELVLLRDAARDAGATHTIIYHPDNIHVHADWR
jgi:hypothetical protein